MLFSIYDINLLINRLSLMADLIFNSICTQISLFRILFLQIIFIFGRLLDILLEYWQIERIRDTLYLLVYSFNTIITISLNILTWNFILWFVLQWFQIKLLLIREQFSIFWYISIHFSKLSYFTIGFISSVSSIYVHLTQFFSLFGHFINVLFKFFITWWMFRISVCSLSVSS